MHPPIHPTVNEEAEPRFIIEERCFPNGVAKPSPSREKTTAGVAQSKKGRRRPSFPRCRSLCTPTKGLSSMPRKAGRLPVRNPIKASEAETQRNCRGTIAIGSCSISCRQKSPSSIQNMTWKSARRV